MRATPLTLFRAALAALLAFAAAPAMAQVAPDAGLAILAGKTVRIMIGGAPGGGTDMYARLFIDGLKAALPHTTIVVQNIDGGGGALAYVEAQSVDSDPVTVVISHSIAIYSQMRAPETSAFDLNRFHWVGALTNNQRVVVVRTSLGVTDYPSLAALGRQLIAPVASGTTFETTLFGAMTGLSLRVVADVDEGLRDTLLMSGQADLAMNSFYDWTVLTQSGNVVPILRIGEDGYPPEAEALPTLADIARPGTPPVLIEIMDSLNKLGRLVGAAPSTDPATVEAFRLAFDTVVATPEFAKAYAARSLALATTPGAEVGARITTLLGNPAAAELLAAFLACGQREGEGGEIDCAAGL